MNVTIECLNSVLTPDAGHCCTIIIAEETLKFPFYDKSVAQRYKLTTSWVEVEYIDKMILTIPLGNIRFIAEDEIIEDKKEKHQVPPYFLKKK